MKTCAVLAGSFSRNLLHGKKITLLQRSLTQSLCSEAQDRGPRGFELSVQVSYHFQSVASSAVKD
jgi:hypothetical protein